MCHWAGSASNVSYARGDVFGKQAGLSFCRVPFAPFNLSFVHACVGLTVVLVIFIEFVIYFIFLVNYQWVFGLI